MLVEELRASNLHESTEFQDVLATRLARAAAAALDAAWADPGPTSAAVAKALAGRAARTAVDAAQQVCGAVGFTAEHPLHRYIRRAIALDALYGSADLITDALGAQLIATRVVPRLHRFA